MKRKIKTAAIAGSLLLVAFAAAGCGKDEESENIVGSSSTLGYQVIKMGDYFTYDAPSDENWTFDDANEGLFRHYNSEDQDGMLLATYSTEEDYDFSSEEDLNAYIDENLKGDDTYNVQTEEITIKDDVTAQLVTLKVQSEDEDMDEKLVLFNFNSTNGYGCVSMIASEDSELQEKFTHIIESIEVLK